MTESRLDSIDEPGELSPQEERFLNAHVVMGMTFARAGKLAGISNPSMLMKEPRMVAALAQLQGQLRTRVAITREDIIAGIKEAIDQSMVIGEPRTAIYGWVEINRLLGYDQPQKIQVEHLTGDMSEMMMRLKQLPEAEILKLAGQNDIIDADFYEVKRES